MPRIKCLAAGHPSEESIQKTVMQWVNLNSKIKHLIFHFANEGKRSPRYGKLLKDLGLKAGVSDLFIAMGRHGFHGAWIELKSIKGIVSLDQKAFLNSMKAQGYFTAVCRSVDDTIRLIDWYCFDSLTS